MNFFEIIILDIMFIIFPLLIYLFFEAHRQNLDKKESNLFFELAILSSIYLTIKFGANNFIKHSFILLNVPLIISYLKNKDKLGVLVSIILVIYYNHFFNSNIFILILEYSIYYLIYYLLNKKDKLNNNFINLFVLIKGIFLIIFNLNKINEVLFMILILLVISYIVILLFKCGEEILNLHMTIKELEKEKQIRTSLFKITHEIKNPIAVCKGYLDMFDVSNIEHSKKYIPIIKDEIKHTLIILQDFLSINKTNINKDILDINLLLDDVVDSLNLVLLEKKIKLDYLSSDDEIFIMGDYNRLKQVLVNVLKNSTEAIGTKENGLITITKKIKNNKIIIDFNDNGCGISNEDLKKLKTPFFTTKQNGTGLGVYLSNEIIEAHSGKMDYSSNIDIGTKVSIQLPIFNL